MNNHKKTNKTRKASKSDTVYTPEVIAKEIINHYKPVGNILDPCKGDGAFYNNINGCLWCEIDQDRDFFKWEEKVDWIISNPPYSILNEWLDHSFKIADNIVYLIPVAKIFASLTRMKSIYKYGGIVEIYVPWTGRDIGFEFGWPVGAVYFKRNYTEKIRLIL